jgi:hypothetical protein
MSLQLDGHAVDPADRPIEPEGGGAGGSAFHGGRQVLPGKGRHGQGDYRMYP